MSQELVAVKPTRRTRFHWGLRLAVATRPKTGRRRVWDRLAALERDLHQTQDLNLRLTELLAEAERENDDLRAQLKTAGATLEEKDRLLKLAQQAYEANTHRVDFTFPSRPIDGHEDMATQPIPRVIIPAQPAPPAAELETVLMPKVNLVQPVKVDVPPYASASAMMLERVASQNHVGTTPPPVAKTQLVPAMTRVVPIIGHSPMAGLEPTHTVPMGKVTTPDE